MKKILVAGGSGLIGSKFISSICKEYSDYMVINLDKISNEFIDFDNYKFVKGDITNRKFIFDLFEREKFYAVINCAVENDVEKYKDEQGIFTRVNIIGTQNLLDGAREYNVRFYHQVSTHEVHDDLSEAKVPGYVASRLAADLLVKYYRKMYDMRISISYV